MATRKEDEHAIVRLFQPAEMERKGPTPIQQRLLDAAARQNDEERSLLYQHSVFCQTSLPFRDPKALRTWERKNGNIHLKVLAGEAMHPEKRELVEVGLPWGAKARFVLMHLNQRALLAQSPVIEVGESFTEFVNRLLKLDPKGRNIRAVKEQLARLAAASIRLGMVNDDHALTINAQIVKAFDIWFPKDERQRVLWPSTVQLSHEYFTDLMEHAVPLDEAHIAALSHSALALDIYSWLAQRLHRIPAGKRQHISWPALWSQFGQGYNPERMNKFRQVFRVALKQVLQVYRAARVEDAEAGKPRLVILPDERQVWRSETATGLWLRYSSPPVKRKLPLPGS